MKKFYLFVFALMVAFLSVGSARAAVTVKQNGTYGVNFQAENGADYEFVWVKLVAMPGNVPVYCYDANRNWPAEGEPDGEEYSEDISALDPALIYILKYENSEISADELGYIKQGAIYLYRSGMNDFPNRKHGVRDDLLQSMVALRNAALSATVDDVASISFPDSQGDLLLNSDGSLYRSEIIKPNVVGSDTYTVTASINGLGGANDSIKIYSSSGVEKSTFSKNEGFYVTVPSNVIGSNHIDIKAKVSTTAYVISASEVKITDGKPQQRVIGLFNEPVETSASVELSPTVCVDYVVVGNTKPDDASPTPDRRCYPKGTSYSKEPGLTTNTKCVFRGWNTVYETIDEKIKLSGDWTDGNSLDHDLTLYGMWECPAVVIVPPTAAQAPFIVLGSGLVALAVGIGYYTNKKKSSE